ncbi:MAG: hypothetical protein ACYDDU_00975 [Dermatophilaceae bacterium]
MALVVALAVALVVALAVFRTMLRDEDGEAVLAVLFVPVLFVAVARAGAAFLVAAVALDAVTLTAAALTGAALAVPFVDGEVLSAGPPFFAEVAFFTAIRGPFKVAVGRPCERGQVA